MKKADLIIHPVRIRIIKSLSLNDKNTKEICRDLSDLPASSLYRHLKILLNSGIIAVSGSRMIKGIEEKTYTIPHPESLNLQLEETSDEEILSYFTIFTGSLIQDFQDYLEQRDRDKTLMEDFTGFHDRLFYASDKEMEEFTRELKQILSPFLAAGKQEGRKLRKFATVLHFIPENDEIAE